MKAKIKKRMPCPSPQVAKKLMEKAHETMEQVRKPQKKERVREKRGIYRVSFLALGKEE